MLPNEIISDQILVDFELGDFNLTLEQFAKVCNVPSNWVIKRVEAGILHNLFHQSFTTTFSSSDLIRALRLVAIERNFDENQELAALFADLIEEINYLKNKLNMS